MAAGLGFKTFTTGEVLSASDVNGYLMQGVLVFASAAARDAAITSPQEGQFAYLKDTNVTTYYTGSAWANLDTTGMTNPMTTTGDTIYSSSGSTPARLAIGSTGQVLTVAGGVPTWATAGGGSMTLLSTTTLSGASVTLSSISQSYRDLRLEIKDPTFSTNNSAIRVQVNSDAGNNYEMLMGQSQPGVASGYNGVQATSTWDITRTYDMQNTSVDASFMYQIFDYKNTTAIRLGHAQASFQKGYSTAGDRLLVDAALFYNNVGTTISSITIAMSAGTFSSGTVTLYGVN